MSSLRILVLKFKNFIPNSAIIENYKKKKKKKEAKFTCLREYSWLGNRLHLPMIPLGQKGRIRGFELN